MCLELAKIFWGHSVIYFDYCFLFQVILKKHFLAKILREIFETLLYESNCNYNSCKFSYKFAFISLFSFRKNQKQELVFQQAGGLLVRSISAFCL